MLEIFFSVKAETQQGEQLRIVGSPPELGEWDPNRAMTLIRKHGIWECGPVERQLGDKFEFKIIKINQDGDVIWQSLPQNSNRKFRPHQSTKLILEWNNFQGQKEIFSPGKRSKNRKATLKSCDEVNSPIKRKFNPFQTAGDEISSSSSEEEQEFNFFQKESQNELSAYDNEFQEIYYRSNSFEVFSGLSRKVKVFVVSSKISLQNSFHFMVSQSLTKLPPDYNTKWITMQDLSGRRKSFCTSQQTVSTFFEIDEEQIHSKSLEESFFVIIDLETALSFSQKVKNKNFGIFLPSRLYDDCLKLLPSLGCEIKWILFDQSQANCQLQDYLIKNPKQSIQIDYLNEIDLNNPTLEQLIYTVVHYQSHNDIIVTPNSILSESEAFPKFTEDNSITILEGGLVDRYNQFVQQLLQNKKEKSIIIIICKENHLHSLVETLRKINNVVIIYDKFGSVIFNNEEYQPLKRLQEILELFRMKIQLYKATFQGAEVVQKMTSISFYLPKEKADNAEKIYNDFKLISSKYSFIRVIKKGRKVKVSWYLAEEARTIRTICQIKHSISGPLGNFNIISDCLSLRQLKNDLKLITQHYCHLFKNGDSTQIRYYSYGGRKHQPTCYVHPKCSDI